MYAVIAKYKKSIFQLGHFILILLSGYDII